MGEWFIGEIRIFPFDWAPEGWAHCDGSVLPIAKNQALFALIGTQYGGDGRTTFALPDLRGRTPVNMGQHPGDPNRYAIGASGGTEAAELSSPPPHVHAMECYLKDGDANIAKNAFLVRAMPDSPGNTANIYAPPGTLVTLASSVGITGSGKGHDNLQPFTVLNVCIATSGIFPPRS